MRSQEFFWPESSAVEHELRKVGANSDPIIGISVLTNVGPEMDKPANFSRLRDQNFNIIIAAQSWDVHAEPA